MAKAKVTYVCGECGYESAGWLGKCPECSVWDSFLEMKVGTGPNNAKGKGAAPASGGSAPVLIGEIPDDEGLRFPSGYAETDRVLGGGFVPGSLTLLGGDPGIGKSTLALQICRMVDERLKTLYVSGEESLRQIKMRVSRLGVVSPNLRLYAETMADAVGDAVDGLRPDLLIIDSIQTMYDPNAPGSPGSVSQIREVTSRLMRIAKVTGVTVLILGHVTKDGSIAGPRALEHMVDTVLYLEGERDFGYRLLRAVKNRFGPTNEVGIFTMSEGGLSEVENPSAAFLAGRTKDAPGSAVVSCVEGMRPLLIEVQALVSPTGFGQARRMTTGADYNRTVLLMAVLEKRMGLALHNCDAYVNVVGGMKAEGPSCDLGIAAALISGFKDRPFPAGHVFFGEVGLTGEVRSVSHAERRVAEASRVGFDTCVMPDMCLAGVRPSVSASMGLIGVSSVSQVAELLA